MLDPASGLDAVRDVFVDSGRIACRAPASLGAAGPAEIDGSGMWLLPGLVDIHAHLRVPGDGRAETMLTGLRAAVAGGVTRVATMPNTDPPIDSPSIVSALRGEAARCGLATLMPVGCVTAGRAGRELAGLADMRAAGAVAFSDDGLPVSDGDLLARALDEAAGLGCPVIEHPEVLDLSRGGRLNRGPVSEASGDPGIPEEAEIEDVSRCIGIASSRAGRLHLTHLSCPRSLELVSEAARRGVRVTCDVTPHHLVLDESAVAAFGSNAVMNPPLRSAESRKALVELVKSGAAAAVASDHAPHEAAAKQGGLLSAAFGITGLETLLPLTLEALCGDGGLSPLEALGLLVTGPSEVLGMEPPSLGEGAPAEMVLFDPGMIYTLRSARRFSKSSNTPFLDRELRGRVRKVWMRDLVYSEDGFA